LQQKALLQLPQDNAVEQLTQAVNTLLHQPEQQISLGEQAYQVVLANQGASNETLLKVKALFPIKNSQ